MSADINEEYKEFLARNKIDTTSLLGTKEGEKFFNVKD